MRPFDRLSSAIALAGCLAGGLAWAFGGVGTGNGVLVGALVAFLNFQFLGSLLRRMLRPGGRKAPLVALLTLKTGGVFLVCWALLRLAGVDAVGFAVGLGALPVGLVLGALLDAGLGPADDAGTPAPAPRSASLSAAQDTPGDR